jgi:alanine racemase
MLASCAFTAMVDSLKTARMLSKTCAKYRVKLNVRLKVNTGMNRYGMNVQMLGKTCKFLKHDRFVRVVGIDSHLCECSYLRAEKQRRCFQRMVAVCKGYFPKVNAYLAATYGTMLGENYRFDGVRVGLGLYGYLPCKPGKKTGVSLDVVQQLDLKKGMAVYAKAIHNRIYQFGGVGYGEEWTTPLKELTVCRVGYADGFLRKQDNGINDWERNASALCMDACIRQGYIKRGQYVPIMTDADEVAALTGTIAYEVLCAATRRAEFVYDEDVTFCGR